MRSLLIVLLLVAPACAKRDLQGLCKLAQDILAEPRIGPTQRFARLTAQSRGFAFSSRTKAMLEEIAPLSPGERWSRVEALAREEVGEPWSCPALREVVSAPAP